MTKITRLLDVIFTKINSPPSFKPSALPSDMLQSDWTRSYKNPHPDFQSATFDRWGYYNSEIERCLTEIDEFPELLAATKSLHLMKIDKLSDDLLQDILTLARGQLNRIIRVEDIETLEKIRRNFESHRDKVRADIAILDEDFTRKNSRSGFISRVVIGQPRRGDTVTDYVHRICERVIEIVKKIQSGYCRCCMPATPEPEPEPGPENLPRDSELSDIWDLWPGPGPER
jgi:hypothetical protein